MKAKDDILALIPSQHAQRPKFVDMVGTVVDAYLSVARVVAAFPRLYDIDESIGAQLDADGVRIGRSRHIPVPIPDSYFSFDIDGLGWDQAPWQGAYDISYGVADLDDATFRALLFGKIAANTWDGKIDGIAPIVEAMTEDRSRVFVTDNDDMSITIGVAGAIPSRIILSLMSQSYLPVTPNGVALDYAITSTDGDAVFGFDVDNVYIAGWDEGSWAASPDFLLLLGGAITPDQATSLGVTGFTYEFDSFGFTPVVS